MKIYTAIVTVSGIFCPAAILVSSFSKKRDARKFIEKAFKLSHPNIKDAKLSNGYRIFKDTWRSHAEWPESFNTTGNAFKYMEKCGKKWPMRYRTLPTCYQILEDEVDGDKEG